jgi:putative endonuclease
MWQVYILKCKDGTFYTGITTDLKRRMAEHNSSVLGAKYTSGRRPVKLVYAKKFKNRSKAAKNEAWIKNLTRENKLKLINKKYEQL